MQAASTIELDSTDRFGNNELHKLVLKGDPQTLFETAIANPDLLIQKNRHGQTPLHLIHFIFAFRTHILLNKMILRKIYYSVSSN